jgi:separase
LLTVYDPHKYPIRRLRIATQILRLDVEQRRDLMEHVKNALAIANIQSVVDHSEDLGLLPLLPHLQSLTSSGLEIQEAHPRVELLKPYLALWCSIIEKSKDHKTLASKIGDVPELVNHLSSIADFLHMKGFANVRVGILRMIANINEISAPTSCPNDLVISYIAVGFQYLELGYSGKAGLALDRAHSYASCNEVTSETLLRMHLSYGEYALAIGNMEKW